MDYEPTRAKRGALINIKTINCPPPAWSRQPWRRSMLASGFKASTTFLILFIFLHRNLGNTAVKSMSAKKKKQSPNHIRVFIIKTSIEQQSLPIWWKYLLYMICAEEIFVTSCWFIQWQNLSFCWQNFHCRNHAFLRVISDFFFRFNVMKRKTRLKSKKVIEYIENLLQD